MYGISSRRMIRGRSSDDRRISARRYGPGMAWFERPRDPQQQIGFEMIGAMVRRRRVHLGWTQRYLQSQSGINQAVISRLENGKQSGLRWSRFAELVQSLGGLDVAPRARPRPPGGEPWADEPPIPDVMPSIHIKDQE
jgi:DNA-binding Xre family transcriptional regulator